MSTLRMSPAVRRTLNRGFDFLENKDGKLVPWFFSLAVAQLVGFIVFLLVNPALTDTLLWLPGALIALLVAALRRDSISGRPFYASGRFSLWSRGGSLFLFVTAGSFFVVLSAPSALSGLAFLGALSSVGLAFYVLAALCFVSALLGQWTRSRCSACGCRFRWLEANPAGDEACYRCGAVLKGETQ